MAPRTDSHALTWWLLSSVFGLLAVVDVSLAVTERTAWPYALAVMMFAAGQTCSVFRFVRFVRFDGDPKRKGRTR